MFLLLVLCVLLSCSPVLSDYVDPPAWSLQGEGEDYQDSPLPQGEVVLETYLKYDNSLLQGIFNEDIRKTKKWINEVVDEAKEILLELHVPVRLRSIGEIEHLDDDIWPDNSTIHRMANTLRAKKLTSFFCGNKVKTPDGYTIGMAFVGMACNDKGSAININAYNKNKEKHSDVILGGRLYAHELGHNLGMW